SAADAWTRRHQQRSRDEERLGPVSSVPRQKTRNGFDIGMLQACQRHVRPERPRLGGETRIARGLFVRPRQVFELRLRLDSGPDRMRIVAAEDAKSGEAEL